MEQKTGGGTTLFSIKPGKYLLKNTFFMESKLHRVSVTQQIQLTIKINTLFHQYVLFFLFCYSTLTPVTNKDN